MPERLQALKRLTPDFLAKRVLMLENENEMLQGLLVQSERQLQDTSEELERWRAYSEEILANKTTEIEQRYARLTEQQIQVAESLVHKRYQQWAKDQEKTWIQESNQLKAEIHRLQISLDLANRSRGGMKRDEE